LNVLVTDGAYLHTLGIVRSLGQAEVEVSVIADSPWAPALHSRYCRRGFVGPPPSDEATYLSFVKTILGKNPFDLLIPVGFLVTRLVSKHREQLSSLVSFHVADHRGVETALCKQATYALAERLDVPYPRTFYPQSIEEVEQLMRQLEYPVVIKALFEEGGNVVRYIQNRTELLHMYTRLCEERGYQPPYLPMLQEFIYSDDIGYSFSALYQDGECKRVFMYREIRSFPIRGGSSTYAESYFDVELKRYGVRLLNALNWHGVAHMDFRRDASGKFRLMEINPKFWASLEVALAAGVNFPLLLCEMAEGKRLAYSEEYERGLRYHWPLSRELKHIARRPRSLPPVLWACLDPRVKSNVWLRDLKPNVLEFAITLGSFWRHLPELVGINP